MPYRATRDLADLFPDEPLERAMRRTAKRVGERIERDARRRTPRSSPPAGQPRAEWLASRRGRRPGAMRSRWHTTAPTRSVDQRGGVRFTVTIENDDPHAVHVEYPTRPHVIRPRADRAAASVVATGRPRKVGDDARLRFWSGGRYVYAREVQHPGTQGVFMLRRSLEDADREWATEVGEDEMRRWATDTERLWR